MPNPSCRHSLAAAELWQTAAVAYATATFGVCALTFLIARLRWDVSVANVSMLYLLVVTLSALFLGRGPAIWTSASSFLAFNWFFVNPRYTLTVQDPAEWVALCMFLLTAIVTSQLMALLKARAREADERQRETTVLADASWAVASHLDTKSALGEVLRQIARVVELEIGAVVAFDAGSPHMVASYPDEQGSPAEVDTAALMSIAEAFLSPGSKGEPSNGRQLSKKFWFEQLGRGRLSFPSQ